jgi:ribosome-associated protein
MLSDQTDSRNEPSIRLDQFLKLAGAVGSGGQAKVLIQGGEVQVNGEVDTRRGRKLKPGDVVEFDGETFSVEFDESAD